MRRIDAVTATAACFLVCVANSFAQAADTLFTPLEPGKVIAAAAAVTPQAFSNADEVLVDDYKLTVYEKSGAYTTWDDEYHKVLTEKGKRTFQSVSRPYNAFYGTAWVERLEIIKPDGKIVPVDVASLGKVAIDGDQMYANIYDPNDKILQVSVPGLETNDIFHMISVERLDKPRVPETWSEYELFEYTAPIRHYVYEVRGPKDLPLRNIAVRDEVAGTIVRTESERDGLLVNRWEVSNVPRMYTEPGMPSLYSVVQRLTVSTIPDWATISRWYWNLCKSHLEAGSAGMKEKLDELVRDAGTREEKMTRIFKFVSQEVRYMGITTETTAPGFEPHDVGVTFDNRYGVCRDKAALLAAMLRLAGLPAYPALIHVGPKKDAEVPQPFFNHAIVAVANGEGAAVPYELMDPTDENTAEFMPAYLCNKSFLVATPEGESLLVSPVIPAAKNMMEIRTSGKLDETGSLNLQSRFEFGGINDNLFRSSLARMKPSDRQRFLEGLCRAFPGAVLSNYRITPENMMDTSTGLVMNLEFTVPDFLVEGEEYAMLSPPWFGERVGYVNYVLGSTGLETRKYPLVTEITCGVDENIEIDLGDAVGPSVSLPDYAPMEKGKYGLSLMMTVSSNVLSARREFTFDDVEFTPGEYLGLKQFLKDAEYEGRKEPVFVSRLKKDENDVVVLSNRVAVELLDAHSWKQRTSVRKRILTYAGKKNNAELSFDFNPAWENVELVSARVVAANGKKYEVAREEVNLMDADWAGSAPRYPGGKTLVVSLPGVEIGSEVEYEVLSTSSNAPFYSARFSFNSRDLIEAGSYRVVVPDGVALGLREQVDETVRAAKGAEDGRRVMEWTCGPQKVIKSEDAMPPWWTFNPTIFLSCGNWKTYTAELGRTMEKALKKSAGAAARARAMTAGLKSKEERIRTIRDFVATDIRGVYVAFTDLPLSCISPPDTTLADGYGNSMDKALLLYAMLKSVGSAPEIVLASSWSPMVESAREPFENCPQRSLFNEVLVRVPAGKEWIYLNDTSRYGKLGTTSHDGRRGLTLRGELFEIRARPGMENRYETQYSIALSDNGDAVMKVKSLVYGTDYEAENSYYSELPPEERRRHYLELLSGLSQAAVQEQDLVTDFSSYPGVVTYAARVPRFAVRSGDELYFELPGTLGSGLSVRTEKREQPIYYGRRFNSKVVLEVNLPAGVRAAGLAPEPLDWEAPAGLGRVRVASCMQENGNGGKTLQVSQQLDYSPAIVPAVYYQALRNLDKQMRHPGNRTVLLVMEPAPAH